MRSRAALVGRHRREVLDEDLGALVEDVGLRRLAASDGGHRRPQTCGHRAGLVDPQRDARHGERTV